MAFGSAMLTDKMDDNATDDLPQAIAQLKANADLYNAFRLLVLACGGLDIGKGLKDEGANKLGLDLAADAALEFAVNSLKIKLQSNSGLERIAAGLKVLLPSDSGLSLGAAGLKANIAALTGLVSPALTDHLMVSDVSDSNKLVKVLLSDLLALNVSGLVPIAQATASTSSTISFTSGIDSTYDHYIIEIHDLVNASNTQDLQMLFSTDGGSTYHSTLYGWNVDETNIANTTINRNSASDSKIVIGPTLENGASVPQHFVIDLWRPSTAKETLVSWRGLLDIGGGNLDTGRILGHGGHDATTDIDAIRFQMGSGNMTSGNFKLYGVKKS